MEPEKKLKEMEPELNQLNETSKVFAEYIRNPDDSDILEPLYCDVFIVSSKDGKRIGVHQFVLIKKSPTLMGRVMNESPIDKTIELDESSEAIIQFRQFLYTSHINLSRDCIVEVILLINQYGDNTMKKVCERFCADTMDESNVAATYEIASTYGFDCLVSSCLIKLAAKIEAAPTQALTGVKREMIVRLLDSEVLCCREANLLSSILHWAHDNVNARLGRAQAIRAEIGDLIGKIRFRSMDVSGFYKAMQGFKGIFNADDLWELIALCADPYFKPTTFNDKKRKYSV